MTSCTELACVPAAIPPEQRAAHFALIKTLFGEQVLEQAALPNGYAFRFDPDLLETVTRFVANERKCCPFLDFELAVAAASGPLWLRMTGPQGTPAVLEAELSIAGQRKTRSPARGKELSDGKDDHDTQAGDAGRRRGTG